MRTSPLDALVPVGAAHPRVRQFSNIKHNRGDSHPDAVALEGLWVIAHALRAGVPIEVVFVCRSLLRGDDAVRTVAALRDAGTITLEVSERVLRRMVGRDGPDGLAAVGHLRPHVLGDVALAETTRVVVADGFELAGNLGTVIRCADGAGASAVLVTERHLRTTHPLVVKASMATLFSLPVLDVERADAASWLRQHRFRIVAADPAAPISYRHADYRGRVALVVGSERRGMATFWKDEADVVVSIPMHGVADSLNVGHAAALLLYEALHAATSSPAPRR